MSVVILGNVARKSEIQTYQTPKGGASHSIYLTVIENHQKMTDEGEYVPAGRTVYDVRFCAGKFADRIDKSFRVGDPVLIVADNVRSGLNTTRNESEPEAVINARGRHIGLSPHYCELSELK